MCRVLKKGWDRLQRAIIRNIFTSSEHDNPKKRTKSNRKKHQDPTSERKPRSKIQEKPKTRNPNLEKTKIQESRKTSYKIQIHKTQAFWEKPESRSRSRKTNPDPVLLKKPGPRSKWKPTVHPKVIKKKSNLWKELPGVPMKTPGFFFLYPLHF